MKESTQRRPDRHARITDFPSAEEVLRAVAALNRPARTDALLRALDLPRRDKKNLEESLYLLAAHHRLLRLRGGLWTLPDKLENLTGRFSALSGGGGFVTPLRTARPGVRSRKGPDARDVHIPVGQTGDAWHKDIVRVALMPGKGHGPSPEGRIVAVEERTLTEVPAHVQMRTGRKLFCRPADSRLPVAFSVDVPDGELPRQGALLLLAPEKQLASDLWSARILGDYGHEDSMAVQEELVKVNHQAPRDFSGAALAEAAALPRVFRQEDLHGREDLRRFPLVTIDGEDARDFDDAIHVERTPNGWFLRVAVADVSHYVRPRGEGRPGALDGEAQTRGNSWYFPLSVEPMLPPALSNDLCSLRPGEDRLAMLVGIPFSADGTPGEARFSPAVMRSAARLTYDQLKDCLLDKKPDALALLTGQPDGQAVLDMLEQALALAALLRQARARRGSLDLDLPEAACRTDEAGRVVWMGHRQRHDIHRLVEEFMIAANEAVARRLRDADLPFLYRVHPRPDADRLRSLFDSLAAAGLEPQGRNPARLRDVLDRAKGTEKEFPVSRLCLRAMPQARYQPDNEGHFGLASQAYCHFTSPIRRYADLLTHRALKTALGVPAGALPAGEKLRRVAEGINKCERAAMACEREMERRMGCLALLPHAGERFRGVIAGVTHFGIFVELALMPVEGMIRTEDLGDDYYDFDARAMSLTGRHSGVAWRMGQSLEVILSHVSLGRLEIRLMPLELPEPVKGGRRAGRRAGHEKRGKKRPEQARARRSRQRAAQGFGTGRRGR